MNIDPATIRWTRLPGSDAPPILTTHSAARSMGQAPADHALRLLIVFKPQTPFSLPCKPMSRAEFGSKHCASRAAMESMKAHGEAFGLTMESLDPECHTLVLTGPCAKAMAAFRPDKIERYSFQAQEFLAREGGLDVPADLVDHVVAVMGFDQRPVARPMFRKAADPRSAQASSYTPVEVAQRYNFPNTTGAGQTIALIELGGGYDADQMAQYFSGLGVSRTGKLTSVSVGGASNTPGDPNGADGEVQLDIEVAGAVANGADIAVYFGTNAGSGFYDAVNSVVSNKTSPVNVISISWGGPESSWSAQDMRAMDQAFQSAAALGITVLAASGDNGADDGTGQKVADFPASSPHALGCGGTTLPRSGPEIAWNDGSSGGATGGGYSTQFSKPSWQSGNDQTMRGVPDIAGNADPQTGYKVTVDGESTIIGGTSAVAPLWAALIAQINQQAGIKAGLPAQLLYQNPSDFNDITAGNNDGYSTSEGWDPVTGLGSPKGAAIARLLARSDAAVA